MIEAGLAYPPKSEFDIAAYNEAEVLEGYMDAYKESQRVEMAPGPNHSPAYRWGWQNAVRDLNKEDDGYDQLRRLYWRKFMKPAAG